MLEIACRVATGVRYHCNLTLSSLVEDFDLAFLQKLQGPIYNLCAFKDRIRLCCNLP
jgi:hypothetical protein